MSSATPASEHLRGLALIDKPSGVTSFASLESTKKACHTRRVGHAGTLDRFAEGLLLVLVGRMTRLMPLFTTMGKTYEAVIRFGEQTDTLDPEGDVVATASVPSGQQIMDVLPDFTGRIQQVPPVFSAVHVAGRRAYTYARRGEQVHMKPRSVDIHEVKLISFEPPNARVRIRCSSGTYIRSLARDLAERAGSCAYVTALRRLAVGQFAVEQAVSPTEFTPHRDLLEPVRFLERMEGVGVLRIAGPGPRSMLVQGAPLKADFFLEPPEKPGTYAAFDEQDELIALVSAENGEYRYMGVFGS